MSFDVGKFLGIAIKFIPYIGNIVDSVEAIFSAPKSGDQKKAAAMVLVTNLLDGVEAGLDKNITSDAKVQDAVSKMIDAYVAVKNAIADAKSNLIVTTKS